MMTFLEQALAANQYTFSTVTIEQLHRYLKLMQQWNRVFNLTAIRDPKEMVLLHILDSLSIGPFLHGKKLIDVGTGAGLPGIPLALTHPDKHFVLLDSNNKKTRFLTQIKLELKIPNIEVVHARCEDFQVAAGFDSIISRAFSSLQVMLQTTQHLIAPAGQFLAMKGTYPAQEIAEIPVGFKVLSVHKLKIAGLEAERHLISVEKE